MGKDVPDAEKHPSAAAPYNLASKLGTRSCHGCYQRKVRCDRAVPCGHCERHNLSCVYPAKAPSVEEGIAKKTVNLQSISNRLARVEDLLTVLVERTERFDVVEAPITKPFAGNVRPGVPAEVARRQRQARSVQQEVQPPTQQDTQPSGESTWEILLNDGHSERPMPFPGTPSVGNTPQSGSAKASLPVPRRTPSSTPRERPAEPRAWPGTSDIYALYPNTQLALQLWSVYVKAVDPVLKILHIPTVQSTVVATILDPKSAAPSTLALTFAIYYAALTAMSDGDALTRLPPDERKSQLACCKAALDSLLTVADLVAHADIPSIQALAIYVTCLRVHEVGRSVWLLNGLAIRLAQSMGLHRDGAHLQLSPFETEMRLRLWWHLCVLDSRAPEDQGLPPTLAVTSWELRLPLNVNDSQLYPGMDALPSEVNAWTEMSFFLVQTESCRRMHPVLETQARQAATPASATSLLGEQPEAAITPVAVGAPDPDPLMQICEKRKMIRDPARMMRRFGMAPDDPTALSGLPRTAVQHMETACRKMEFVLQLREEMILQRRADTTQKKESAALRPSFRLACAALASSRALLHDSAATPFGWFFGTYTQWYALAYVLRCLCCLPRELVAETQSLVELAWDLVDELFPSTLRHPTGNDENENEHDGSIWHYLHRLRDQAALVRDEQARVVAQDPGVVQPQQSFDASSTVPLMDQDRPSSDALFTGVDVNQDMSMPQNTEDLFSSLDLFMADIQFLPDWDTVINM